MAPVPGVHSVLAMLNPESGAAPAIEAQDVVKTYGTGAATVHALRGVALTIRSGEFVAIMGPSGSGKSTLLHILGALEPPTSGVVAVGGRRYDQLDDRALTRLRRDHIGFVFQFFNLLPLAHRRRERPPAGAHRAPARRRAAEPRG